MGIKFDWKSPIGVGTSGAAALAAWTSSGFATDPKHIALALSAGMASSATQNLSSSKPNVAADSHIITPYANNVTQVDKP